MAAFTWVCINPDDVTCPLSIGVGVRVRVCVRVCVCVCVCVCVEEGEH